MKSGSMRKCILKLFALFFMCIGGIVLLQDETVKATGECHASYDQCMIGCDLLIAPTPEERTSCRGACIQNLGVCTNEQFLSKEGNIYQMLAYDDFNLCMSFCPTCPLDDYIGDFEGLQECTASRHLCKLDCLAPY